MNTFTTEPTSTEPTSTEPLAAIDLTDARSLYGAAQDRVAMLLAGVRPDQYELPTPSAGWDVRALCGHLVGTVDRARGLAVDGTFETTSADGPRLTDDRWVDAFAGAVVRQRAAWADDDVLDSVVTVPWGQVPARAALVTYVRELYVHGWDLAVATGQQSEGDAATAEALLVDAVDFLPAGIRAAIGAPFDEPAEPATGAGPTERLANWFGHVALVA